MALFQQGTWNSPIGLGNWDLGLSEALGIGKANPAVAAGGALFFNPNQSQASTQSQNTNNVLGATVQNIQQENRTPYGPPVPTTNTTRTTAPTTQSVVPSIDPIMSQIDSAYNDRINSLNNISSQLRSYEPTIYDQANSIFNAAKSVLDTGKASSLTSLGESETAASKRKQDSDIASTRLYNELMQGGRQRYGGASSAGQAFTEIANVEQQRRAAANEADYGTTVRQIMALREDTENKYTQGLAQAEAQKQTAISQAKQNLQNKLIEIDQMKDAAAADKNNARLSALQEYRNNIFDVNMQVASFQQTLEAQRRESLAMAQQYESLFGGNAMTGSQATQNYFGADSSTLNPQSNIVPQTNTQGGGLNYIGMTTPRREETPIGAYDPRRDFFFG